MVSCVGNAIILSAQMHARTILVGGWSMWIPIMDLCAVSQQCQKAGAIELIASLEPLKLRPTIPRGQHADGPLPRQQSRGRVGLRKHGGRTACGCQSLYTYSSDTWHGNTATSEV